jgi:hypothetical protein
MQTRWIKILGAALVVGALGAFALGAVAFAQEPTPTTPETQETGPMRGFGFFGFGPGLHGGPGHRGGFGFGGPGLGPRGGENSLLAVAAEALDTTASELVTDLQAGQTLSELADAENVSTATIVNDYLAPIEETLTTAVTEGRITQAQADAMLALKKANAEAAMDYRYDPDNLPVHSFGWFGGKWPGGRTPAQPPASPEATPESS